MLRRRLVTITIALIGLGLILSGTSRLSNVLAAESEAGIPSGTVITQANWQQYKGFMAPSMRLLHRVF
jgi:hypothetical protein